MDMTDPPGRAEFDARLEAAQARNDAQFTRLSDQIGALAAKVDSLAAQFTQESAALKAQMIQVLADNKNTRATILVVSLGSMFAAVTMVIAVQVGLMNAFSAGISSRAALAAGWSPPSSATAGPAQR